MTTKTYAYTGAGVGFTIPIGVTTLTAELQGATGGATADTASYPSNTSWTWKQPGKTKGTFPVSPGTVAYLHVGSNGKDVSTAQNGPAAGGYVDGGSGAISSTTAAPGGPGGGGYSDIRYPDNALTSQKMVAAGSGGAWGGQNNYSGGSMSGGNGTQTAGGAAGTCPTPGQPGPGGYIWHAGSDGTVRDYNGVAGARQQGANAPSPARIAAHAPIMGTTYKGSIWQAAGGGGGYYGGGSGAQSSDAYGSVESGDGGNGSNYVGASVTATVNTAPGTTYSQSIQPSSGAVDPRPTGYITLTYSLPPNAPALAQPFNNSNVDNSQAVTFGWTDSTPPETGDYVTGAQIQYRAVGDTDWTQLATVASNAETYTAPVGTFPGNTNIEWQVRSVGHLTANYGPWSASYFFEAIAPPATPSITAPTAGQSITASPQMVMWTQVSGQQAFEVRRVADNAGVPNTATVYRDSGVLDNPSSSYSMPFDAATRTEHVQVRVMVNALWSAWADVSVAVAIAPPSPPTLTTQPVIVALTSTVPDAIAVTVTNPSGGVAVDHNDVYRSDPRNAEVRVAAGLAPNSTWTDNTVASKIVYTYRAVAVAANGAGASS